MVDNQPGAARHYTVAELVARERAAARAAQRRQPASVRQSAQQTQRIKPVQPQPADGSPTRSLHVTELLRREGVEYGENATEQEESATEAPPALAARTQREKTAVPSRAGMFGRAAVLFGLTVGGLVGLQSTLASTPDGSTLAERGGPPAAPEGIERTTTTTETGTGSNSGGGAAPTTSADVELQDNATQVAPSTSQQAPADAPAGSSGGTGDTASAPTTTNAPAPTTENAAPRENTAEAQQQDGSQSQQDDGTSQQDDTQQDGQSNETGSEDGTNDDGNVVGEVLDPVTGTVSGVLDAGTDLLGL